MAWVNVGVAAVGVVGSLVGSGGADKAAKRAARAQTKAAAAELDFAKEQYAEWQETYGDLEDNLATYYEQLTPTLRTMQGLEAFEKEREASLTGLRENLAQRGIGTSGIAAQTETTIALESASERARIRAAAPLEAAREQSSFLSIGLGQNPVDNISGILSGNTARARNIESATATSAGKARSALVESGTNLASELTSAFLSKGEK